MNNELQTIESTVAQMGYDTVLAFRSSLKGKDKKVVDEMFNTYEMVNGDNEMLQNAFIVYKRLHPLVKRLTSKEQFEIIHESTMIAYDARISAFDHMANYKPDLELPENES